MNLLSVAIIAHNEADNIAETLRSISWADQIVVVDCESGDETVRICRDFNVDLYSEPNRSNLNINKNIAIEHCNSDWVLVLDADEIIPYNLAGEIRLAMEEGRHNGYLMARRNHVLGCWLKYGGQYPDWQLRLFRRTKGRFPAEHIHERLRVEDSVGKLKEPFDHFPYRTLKDMIRKGSFYTEFETNYLDQSLNQKSPSMLVLKAGINPAVRFVRRYFFKGGFLDGIPGFAASTGPATAWC